MATELRNFEVTEVKKSKDGDTYIFFMPVTDTFMWQPTVRLDGYDTPESKSPASTFEKRQSTLALAFVRDYFLKGPGMLVCHAQMKTDPFGRQLGTIWHEFEGIRTLLGESLKDAGLATVWPQRWYEKYDPQRNKTI